MRAGTSAFVAARRAARACPGILAAALLVPGCAAPPSPPPVRTNLTPLASAPVVSGLPAAVGTDSGFHAPLGGQRSRPLNSSIVPTMPTTDTPADARLVPARDALARQDYRAALRLCAQAQRQGTARPDALHVRSDIYKAADYLDKEIESLQQWRLSAPRVVEPCLKLFYIYLDLGWWREAQRESDAVLVLAWADPRAHIARALLFYQSTVPERGLAPAERARQIQPENLQFANIHATILLKCHRFAQAEAVARQALARDPARPENRLALGSALLGQNKDAEAGALYQEMWQQQPDSPEAAYELGVLAYKQNRAEDALRFLEPLARQDIGYSKTAWYLGNLYRKLGRAAEGNKLLQTYQTLNANDEDYEVALKRLRSHPDAADLHSKLAQMHADAAELPQAIVEWQRAQKLSPGDASIRKSLAQALRRHGRVAEAQQLAALPASR